LNGRYTPKAQAFPSDRANALGAGCDAYLEKPIDNERLVKLVERFVSGS